MNEKIKCLEIASKKFFSQNKKVRKEQNEVRMAEP